jgi:hypothetical protein
MNNIINNLINKGSNVSLTYNKDFVEVKGSNNSTIIPVSAISAVFIETKKAPKWVLICSIICGIIGLITIFGNGDFNDDKVGIGIFFVLVGGTLGWTLIMGIFNKSVYGIRCDGREYTVIGTVSEGNVVKDELSKIVIEGRRQCQQIKE